MNAQCVCISVCSCIRVCSAIIGSAGHSMLTHGTRVHTNTHAMTQKHTLWFLLRPLSSFSSDHHQEPPCLTGSPSPGITQRRWALTSSAMGKEPAAGAEVEGGCVKGRGRNMRGGFIKEGKKKSGCEEAGERGKGGGRWGLHITYFIIYKSSKCACHSGDCGRAEG